MSVEKKDRPHFGCTASKPGRCRHNGRRTMAHICTHFPGHTKTWHHCHCGHAWPTTPPDND